MGIANRKRPKAHHFHSSNRVGEGIALSYISSDWLSDKLIIEPRELEYLEYEEHATEQYQELIDGFSNDRISSMNYARDLGVEREWEVYNFFARPDINAPEELFTFINDKGQADHFTKEQIDLISQWEKGDPVPIEGVKGHHMELIRDNPGDIDLATAPNNILFATETGHIQYLHGGNTKNPTSEEYFQYSKTTDEQLEETLQHNEDLITLNVWEAGAATVTNSMAMYASISMLAEWYRLRHDPRPWVVKQNDLIRTGIATSLFGAGLSTIGYATNVSLDTFFAGVSFGTVDVFFTEMLAVNGSFLAIVASGAVLRYFWAVNRGQDLEEAKKELQSVMMVASAEFLAFSALGLGLDVLADYALDTAVDALIPDPTGILIAARALYGISKLGKKIWDSNQNKQAVRQCINLRLESLYDRAQRGLGPGNSYRFG